MIDADSKIAIAGAGAIGLYVGGRLAAAGRRVAFLARPAVVQALWKEGLTVTDSAEFAQRVSPDAFDATADLDAAFAGAEIVLVTVKSKDTAEMAAQIAARAREVRCVASFQNGVRNAARLRGALPGADVRAGMVPFNVALDAEPPVTARRTTQGRLVMEGAADDALSALLSVPGLPVVARRDMDRVLFSKLLINLNNAVNALSGLPLARQMSDWRWRAISAECMAEAIEIARASGRGFGKVGPMRPALTPTLLSLPNWAFIPLMRRINRVDPKASSSMQEDFRRGRETEIEDLQGEIARMAEAIGRDAPVNRAIAELVRDAEALNIGPPMLEPETVARRCGLQI